MLRFFFLLLSQEIVPVWDLHRVNSELSRVSGCTVAAEFSFSPPKLGLCPMLVSPFLCQRGGVSALLQPDSGFRAWREHGLGASSPHCPGTSPGWGWLPPCSVHQTCPQALQQMGKGARKVVRKVCVNRCGLLLCKQSLQQSFCHLCWSTAEAARGRCWQHHYTPLDTLSLAEFAPGTVWNSAAPKQ